MTQTKWKWPPPPGQLRKLVQEIKSPKAFEALVAMLAQIRDQRHAWLLEFVEEVARREPLFASRLFEKCAALHTELEPITAKPWLVDDGNGLAHTPSYSLCRANGPWLECSPVVALSVRSLSEFQRGGFAEMKCQLLLERAQWLAAEDVALAAEIASLRQRDEQASRGYSPAKKLARLFSRAGVWKRLVWPGKKATFRLELREPYV